MGRFIVRFLKNIVSSDGHPFKCLQGEIVVRRATSVDRALQAAELRFERRYGVPDWRDRADTLEVAVDGHPAAFAPKNWRNSNIKRLRYIPGARCSA